MRNLSFPIRIASVCAALPLVAGVSIFAAWYFTRRSWLQAAGVWNILIGVLLFVVGILMMAAERAHDPAADNAERLRRSRQRKIVTAMLLVNFGVAAALVWAASVISSRYVLTVENRSSDPIDDVEIAGGGATARLGRIAPGESRSFGFWPHVEDTLTVHAVYGSTRVEIHNAYVCSGLGDDVIIEVPTRGKSTVRSRYDH